MKVTIHDPKNWEVTREVDIDVKAESGAPVKYSPQNERRGAGRPRKPIAIPADKLPEREWFTVPEVAEITGYHVRTIQARLRDGSLQGKKLGGVWRIYRESLERA